MRGYRPLIIEPDSEAWRLLTELGRVARDVEAASLQAAAARATGSMRVADHVEDHIGRRAEVAVDLALRLGLEWAAALDLAQSGIALEAA